MKSAQLINRRRVMAAAGTGLLVGRQPADAAPQPLQDITIRILDGLAQPLNRCVVDFSELQTGVIRRATQTGPAEYQVPCGRGPQLLTAKRSADRPPELTIQQLWGPDGQRIAIQLPGPESTVGRIQKSINQVNALQQMFFLGLLYPEFRAATFNADTIKQFYGYASEAMEELQSVQKFVQAAGDVNRKDAEALAGYLGGYKSDLFGLLEALE